MFNKKYLHHALLRVLSLSLYFYNIRKRGEGVVSHFLTRGRGGGGPKRQFISNVIKVQPLAFSHQFSGWEKYHHISAIIGSNMANFKWMVIFFQYNIFTLLVSYIGMFKYWVWCRHALHCVFNQLRESNTFKKKIILHWQKIILKQKYIRRYNYLSINWIYLHQYVNWRRRKSSSQTQMTHLSVSVIFFVLILALAWCGLFS